MKIIVVLKNFNAVINNIALIVYAPILLTEHTDG